MHAQLPWLNQSNTTIVVIYYSDKIYVLNANKDFYKLKNVNIMLSGCLDMIPFTDAMTDLVCTCAIEAISSIPSNTGAVIATSSVNTNGILMAFIEYITSTLIDIWRKNDEVVETK